MRAVELGPESEPLPELVVALRLAWRAALRSARAALRSAEVVELVFEPPGAMEPETVESPWALAPALLPPGTWAFTSARVLADMPPLPAGMAAPEGVPPP